VDRSSAAHTEPRNDVGPHEFDPLRRPAISDNARCRACYLPEGAHPVEGWTRARPLGDRRRADFRFAVYEEAS
jgi:hypothetical protein